MLEKFSRDCKEGAKLDYNQRLFTTVAPVYDKITGVLSFGCDRRWKRVFIKMLPHRAYNVGLDVACGTGDVTFALKLRFQDTKIYGVDVTPSMLEHARAKDVDKKIVFVLGDMCAMPFDEHSFDLLTGAYALRNAPDVDGALREFYRVLRPNGIIAFLDFSRSSWRSVAAMQYMALKAWGGLIGLFYHRNPAVYGYIAESLQQFPDRAQLVKRIEKLGFEILKKKRFMCGMIEVIICQKK